MNHIRVRTEDNYELTATEFIHEGGKNVSIIINSATAVPHQFYYFYARYLMEQGYYCLCWDYRGIGKTKLNKEEYNNISLDAWGNADLSAIINHVKNKNPDNKIYILGHSIGGAILGLTPNAHLVDGVLLYAAQTAYYKDWAFPYNMKLYLQWHVLLPLVTAIYGYFPGKRLGLGTNLPKKYVVDFQKRKRHPDIQHLFKEMGGGKLYFDQYNCPIFCFNMTDDHIATPVAVERMNSNFNNAQITSIRIDPASYRHSTVGHFDFFKRGFEEDLWVESLGWIEGLSKT